MPTTRAVVGAILIAVAGSGVLMAHRAASAPPASRYVVVTADLAAGSVVKASDLGTLAIDVPAGLNVVPARDVRRVVGRVTRTELTELDPLRSDDLFERGRFSSPGSVEVGVEVKPARALAGAVKAGDVVDVMSTDPDGAGTTTLTTGATVVSVSGRSDGASIGTSSTLSVRLALDDGTVAPDVVDAAVRAQITLVLPSPARSATGQRGRREPLRQRVGPWLSTTSSSASPTRGVRGSAKWPGGRCRAPSRSSS